MSIKSSVFKSFGVIRFRWAGAAQKYFNLPLQTLQLKCFPFLYLHSATKPFVITFTIKHEFQITTA